MLLTLSLLGANDAQAFCGTYVGQVGADLYNNASQIAVARQGTRTTLTLVNDFEGDASEFAIVVPVPEVLGAEDVAVVEPDVVTRVDAYSAPRLVRYECEDFQWEYDAEAMDSGLTSEGGGGGNADDSVTVEAEFSVGEYDIVILSAEESAALITWLNDNGYGVGTEAEDLLGEYLASGSKFFAAKVNLANVPEGASYLSPLQFGYDSDVFSLPIRLGTLNSGGEQDLILYMLSDSGQTHISNYPEVEVETGCMVDLGEWDSLGAFVDDRFKNALATAERPGWALEYGWTASGCDPCADDPLADEDVQALGWEGEAWDAYFSRIHMRYGPEAVDQDLVFYASGLYSTTQIRYIEYDRQLEDRFPNCGLGWATDPGTCEDGGTDPGTDPGTDDPGGTDWDQPAEPRNGCGVPVAPALGLALLGFLALRRRD
ncbi:MAG TPA: DUF2330 domain-containing protein [Myxococcota bacterium]|nr:DUF2330 domain-containing protein [Myxococcota bacterium]